METCKYSSKNSGLTTANEWMRMSEARKERIAKHFSLQRRKSIVKGKPWTVDKENRLHQIVQDKGPLGVIAARLGKGPEAVREEN